MKRLLTALLALALLTPGAAAAAPDTANCTFKVKKTIRVSAAVKKGLPVTVRCDRETKVVAPLDFVFGTKQDRKWLAMHNEGVPGISTGAPRRTVGRRAVFRAKLTKKAGRFLNRYKRSKLEVGVGAQDPEHPDWYRAASSKRRVVTFLGRG